MQILDANSDTGQLCQVFGEVDGELAALEQNMAAGNPMPLSPTVDHVLALVTRLVLACIADTGKKQIPAAGADILDLFKVLVKGEPSWTAIRDNCRELVYYRNCISMGREDALPPVAEKMAVRTARHIYLYMKTRCIREGRLQD